MPNITVTIGTNHRARRTISARHGFKRKTPRFRTGLFWLTALGFQRLAVSHL
ncbi:hypothetical protein [Bradyrhizobium nitroreducens]|uniref:hypothetical protein n=1 Tax=Bradyrhizobium nitroreducens TaxID=709803 RepID=UPI001374E8C7|nr:hypothetical protein [Bradyrhizobium nitroreducens]